MSETRMSGTPGSATTRARAWNTHVGPHVLAAASLAIALAGPLLAQSTSPAATTPSTSESDSDAPKPPEELPTIAAFLAGPGANTTARDGFVRLHVDDRDGTIYAELPPPGTPKFSFDARTDARLGIPPMPSDARLEAIHVVGIRTGLGSNPVGLDRGQLGGTTLVRFRDLGGRVLLEAVNLAYRARTSAPAERRAVAESFAPAMLWATPPVARDDDGRVLIDLGGFLKLDLHGIARTLDSTGQGSFSLDGDRSVVLTGETLAFPDNVELESLLTFTSKEPGRLVRQTAADATAPAFVVHHSFVRPPATGYEPRPIDPRIPSFGVGFQDYAAPLADDVRAGFIARHRLGRPDAPRTVLYHVDAGAPEPVRGALVDGARWWAEAFEAAGFPGAYRVEVMPEGVHPMDVRYNVIQWVHRSTRGWSYGASVIDPRTGEILKGHVSLGSLRVRQDRLLFEGLLGTDATGSGAGDDPIELSLARIRQLAAHEVGHTLGFAHNFAASADDRASVMDYPAPRIGVRGGAIDVSDAYATGIGAWDIRSVELAYGRPQAGETEAARVTRVAAEARDAGLVFMSDADARGLAAAHPRAVLWDNGDDPVTALRTAMAVRAIGLQNFGVDRLHRGRPMSELHEVFVPVYLHHRYQIEAAARLIGGVSYVHEVRPTTDGIAAGQVAPVDRRFAERVALQPVDGGTQVFAMDALLETLAPDALDIPDDVLRVIPPNAFGQPGSIERFSGSTGLLFDPLAAAGIAADATLAALLDPRRCARLVAQHRLDPRLPGYADMLQRIQAALRANADDSPRQVSLNDRVRTLYIGRLIRLAASPSTSIEVRATTNATLTQHVEGLGGDPVSQDLRRIITRHLDRRFDIAPPVPSEFDPPPGSPIGSGRIGS
ncbi:MAG: zinc-dependent metalloprotease, partial [Phycisphaerales bacterium]